MMESPVSPLFLEEYLGECARPAIILSSRDPQSTGVSLEVYYANRALLDIVGYDDGTADELTSLLQTKCIHPSMSRFVRWIDQVLRSPRSKHVLRTSFQAKSPPQAHVSSRHTVDIEWKPVVLRQTYVILMGKVKEVVSYFNGENAIEKQIPSCTRSPESNSNVSDTGISVSSNSSTKSSVGHTNRTTTYFMGSETAPAQKNLEPWSHNEKVTSTVTPGMTC